MNTRLRRLGLAAALATATAVAWAVPALSAPSASTTVSVGATEMKFTLSKSSARAGTVVFVVKNTGSLAHDFKIAGKKTATLKPGKSTKLTVTLKKGSYPIICTITGHAAAGMKSTFKVV